MKIIDIIGAGGHTRSSLNILKENFRDYTYNIFDDSFCIKNNEYIHGIKIVGRVSSITRKNKIFLSIGDNKQRSIYFEKFNKWIIRENLFHKTCYCEEEINFGIANQIYANVYINSYVNIGNDNIINTSAILEHEVSIGNHNHISVDVKLCGRVKVGNNCMIGANTTVRDKIFICDDVIIGAGSVVVKDILEKGIYVGVPARKIK